tara:strand:- start:7 stop:468 length:462 start_codon:yes stop_codon:yes gene_type:complete
MATVYGVNFTKYDQNVPKEMVNVSENGGRMRVIYDTYVASALAKDSTIYVGRLPKGARVWNVLVSSTNTTANNKLAVGVVGDTDKFIAATAMTVDGQMVQMASDAAVVGGNASAASFGVEITAQTDVVITTSVSTGSNTHTGTIKCCVWYTVD